MQGASRGLDWTGGGGGELARAARTLNISLMSVTLDVSKLSGWLNASIYCQVTYMLNASIYCQVTYMHMCMHMCMCMCMYACKDTREG